ncbi:conserved hypothetical protein [Thermoproteus tenax Kra 1]|uniref:Radical SAM core domain-containing protein n=1 Tax=Thermoproteus tenax (strain ATCC 35583 / DSM 2078 / JCM 9277 / NBRC 100435 / Kra 1) TaxID=768679 RepID=G4RN48_THETK|nr:conserved hypothetical protein [Thermoproteus tenax Kra 1]
MEAWRRKQEALRRLRELLKDVGRAERDHHARRPPRPCGITVHTGVGCPLACAYCYIYDMGFPGAVKPYPLAPLEMAYALAANPYVAVGERGTLVAVGSVTEPFLPETRGLALGYIAAIAESLGNPIQVSTKYPPPAELARYSADVLISVTDAEGRLEPRAPKPVERIKGAEELIKRGGSVALFVRPVVPGVTDRDIERLLALAWDAGIRRVIFGTLRVTSGIAARLRPSESISPPTLRPGWRGGADPDKISQGQAGRGGREVGLRGPARLLCLERVGPRPDLCALQLGAVRRSSESRCRRREGLPRGQRVQRGRPQLRRQKGVGEGEAEEGGQSLLGTSPEGSRRRPGEGAPTVLDGLRRHEANLALHFGTSWATIFKSLSLSAFARHLDMRASTYTASNSSNSFTYLWMSLLESGGMLRDLTRALASPIKLPLGTTWISPLWAKRGASAASPESILRAVSLSNLSKRGLAPNAGGMPAFASG